MTILQPGMRCVCIQTVAPSSWRGPSVNWPVKGRVYTVRHVLGAEYPGNYSGVPCLRLLELCNEHLIGCVVDHPRYERRFRVPEEPAFRSVCFRPLSESRLDQFRNHLAPAPRQKADA